MTSNFVFRENCPVCKGKKKLIFSYPYTTEFLWSLLQDIYGSFNFADFQGINYEMVKCNDCGLYFQTYIPTDDFYWKNLYREKTADKPMVRHKSGLQYYRERARDAERISILLAKKPHEIRVLEFGSGFGHWLLMAKAYGYDTWGIEIKQNRIDFSRALGLSVFDDLSKVDGTFDYIFSEAVFEHVTTPLAYAQNLADRLNRGGILNISIPFGGSERSHVKAIETYKSTQKPPKIIDPLEHINMFTNNSIRTLGKQVGLTPIPTSILVPNFLRNITPTQNLHYLQEAIKIAWKHNFANDVFFIKK